VFRVVAIAAAIGFAWPAIAHEDDPKGKVPHEPVYGPIWTEGGVASTSFESAGVSLKSWIPLNQFNLGGATNTSGNDCWGYVSPAGREYAIMGCSDGTGFVEITDPAAPVVVGFIPGPQSNWRNMKTYQTWCYAVSEGGSGIQVIDLAQIDSGTVTLANTVTAGGNADTHTMIIDEASGFLYRMGGGATQGLRIYSLANPASPAFVTTWGGRYVHDGCVTTYSTGPYAGKQVFFACGGFNGGFGNTGVTIIDVTNKSSIVQLAHFEYPDAAFCHQAWFSEDKRFLYLNDELDESYFGVPCKGRIVDIQDLSNPTLAGTFTVGLPTIDHNEYVRGNHLFSSSYKSGLRIFDITDPVAPVEIAWFDTFPEGNSFGFGGLWSNYPFFPSGTIIGSDMQRGLFVWRLERPVALFGYPSGVPSVIAQAGGATLDIDVTPNAGVTFAAGSPRIRTSIDGGAWVEAALTPLGGDRYRATMPAAPCGATVRFQFLATDTVSGLTTIEPASPFSAVAALDDVAIFADSAETDLGWSFSAANDTAIGGRWERVAAPNGTPAAPDADNPLGTGTACFVTGQGSPGGALGEADVDDGMTSLTSPRIDLAGVADPILSYARWYSNSTGLAPYQAADALRTWISNNDGATWVAVETVTENLLAWKTVSFRIADLVAPTANMRIKFTVADSSSSSIVEAAVDDVRIRRFRCDIDGDLVADEEDPDLDGDGTANGSDGCPSDPLKTAPGACGCGTADTDGDGDGTPNCFDGCPSDPAKIAAGQCGCGTADTDVDADGLADCVTVSLVGTSGTLSPAGVVLNDEFGAVLARDGDLLAVGSPLDDRSGLLDAGSVRIFRRIAGAWTQEAELVAPDAAASDTFGRAVAVSGDLVAIGAPMANPTGIADAGVAYVFRKVGSSWSLDQRIQRPSPVTKDYFGTAIAIRGNLLAVGGTGIDVAGKLNAGQVAVYRRGIGANPWTEAAALSGVPVTASDVFGRSVAFGGPSAAPVLAVGASGDDQPGIGGCGAVYVHSLATAGTVVSTARLVAAQPRLNAGLGVSVAIDEAGTTIASGAPLSDPPSALNAGIVTAWTFASGAWTGVDLVVPDRSPGEQIGMSIAVSEDGRLVVAGSPLDGHAGIAERGSAVAFDRRPDGSWRIHDRLLPADGGTSASRFGTAVAITGDEILVGAPRHSPPPGGSVMRFVRPDGCDAGDADSDGTVDCLDTDDDGDGTPDLVDGCPFDPAKSAAGQCGCGTPESADADSDGSFDCVDGCPSDPAKVAPGTCGCGVADTDADSDGTPNCNDGCPTDAAKTAPGLCGCGVAETGDTDGDTSPDCLDTDDDGDGTPDSGDGCPTDAMKTSPGLCGCGVPDTDSDADATPDCNDGCPADPLKLVPGPCGCGVADVDADADGLLDCLGDGNVPDTGELPVTGTLAGDDFGAAVAGDGAFAIVGLPLDDLVGKVDAGSARIYEAGASGWTQVAELLAPSASSKTKDAFGSSVAISGNLAVVGAPLFDVGSAADAGAAFVFRRVGSSWTLEATLTRAAPLAGDRFGHSVAALGNLVAVGAPLANIGTVADPGQVSVFRFESSAWTPRAVINADAVVAGDKFGQSVAFGGTESSAVLAVGTPGDDAPSRTNCGSVFVHVLGPTGLVVSANRLISPVPLTSALLGMGVTVDGTGTRVAAGAPLADVTGIGTDCGAATVWTLASGSWSGVELAPVDRAAGENFGTSLAFRADGAALVIGSPLDFVSGIAGRGSAVVMVREGSAWSTYDRLVLPAVGTSAANLGRAVGFRGSEILVGGPKQAPGGTVRTFASPP
jgi:choice-of-anchor B domain-containing protein